MPDTKSPQPEVELVETEGTAPAEPNNREARYRVERNEARTERDELASRIEQLQTRELHRLAADVLSAPEDISLAGKPLSEFLTPEGWVDKATVAKVAQELAQARPGLAKASPAYDPSQGRYAEPAKSPNWGTLIAP